MTSSWESGAKVNKCVTCAANHYKVNDDKNCCAFSVDGNSEIWNGTACAAISSVTGASVITDCKIYDNTSTSTAIKDSYLCNTCDTSTNFPST